MRRFIEEIRVQDPMIAHKIIEALEAKPEKQEGEKHTVWKPEPRNNYEVEMYEHNRDFDITRNKPDERGYILLKIFVREDV